MIEFNLLDERKLEKSSVHCELTMFLFLLFVVGTTKSGISRVIFQFRLFSIKSIPRNKLCCMRVMTELWVIWILLQFLIVFSSLVLPPFSVSGCHYKFIRRFPSKRISYHPELSYGDTVFWMILMTQLYSYQVYCISLHYQAHWHLLKFILLNLCIYERTASKAVSFLSAGQDQTALSLQSNFWVACQNGLTVICTKT